MQIPDSIDEAVLDLKGIGELVTASEWKRAAIVWAFTEDGRGKNGKTTVLSCKDLASQGIAGLKSDKTVRQYRAAWKRAIADGYATDVKPGDEIDLPDIEWQAHFNPQPSNKDDATPPKKRRKTNAPRPHPKREEMVGLADEGQSTPKIAEEVGLSKRLVRSELEHDAIEREAKAEAIIVDYDSLPGRVKEREAVLRRQIRRELESEFEPRVQDEVQKRVAASRKEIEQLRSDAQRVLAGRKGIVTRADYDLIRSCLHPDSRLSVTDEKLAKAFQIFNEAEILFLDESNYSTLPSIEELRKRREK